jgi:hypothetical protein
LTLNFPFSNFTDVASSQESEQVLGFDLIGANESRSKNKRKWRGNSARQYGGKRSLLHPPD